MNTIKNDPYLGRNVQNASFNRRNWLGQNLHQILVQEADAFATKVIQQMHVLIEENKLKEAEQCAQQALVDRIKKAPTLDPEKCRDFYLTIARVYCVIGNVSAASIFLERSKKK